MSDFRYLRREYRLENGVISPFFQFVEPGLGLISAFLKDSFSMEVVDGRVVEIQEVLEGRVESIRWSGQEGSLAVVREDVTVIRSLFEGGGPSVTIPTVRLEEIMLDWRAFRAEFQAGRASRRQYPNGAKDALTLLMRDGVNETVTWRRVKELFPADWSRERLLEVIAKAHRRGYFVVGSTFEGYADEGGHVVFVLDDELRIITAYPRARPVVRCVAVDGEATRFFPIFLKQSPWPERRRILPVVLEEVADEGLVHVLHSDSGLFRGGGLARFDDVLAGRVECVEVSGSRTHLVIGREVTTVTDLYADPEHGVGFVPLVMGTGELRANVVAWLRMEDDFFEL